MGYRRGEVHGTEDYRRSAVSIRQETAPFTARTVPQEEVEPSDVSPSQVTLAAGLLEFAHEKAKAVVLIFVVLAAGFDDDKVVERGGGS